MPKLYRLDEDRNYIAIDLNQELALAETGLDEEKLKDLFLGHIDLDKNILVGHDIDEMIKKIHKNNAAVAEHLRKKLVTENKNQALFDDFDDIADKFTSAADSIKDKKEREYLENLLDKIRAIKITEEESGSKMGILANALLQEYSERIQSFGAERNETVKIIRQFFIDEFGINLTQLDESLLKKNKLNLAALLLENETGTNIITEKFAAMLGKKYTELKKPEEKELFIWELNDYRTRKSKKGERILDVFGSAKKRRVKTDVADQLISALRNDEKEIALNISERAMLEKGELKEILDKHQSILPVDYRDKYRRLYENGVEVDIRQKFMDAGMSIAHQDVLGNYFDFDNNQMKLSSLKKIKSELLNDRFNIPENEENRAKALLYNSTFLVLEKMLDKNPELEAAKIPEVVDKTDFTHVTKDFGNTMHKVLTPSKSEVIKKSILNSFHKISLKKDMTSPEKIEVFVDMLIHKYAALKKSDNKDQLASEIAKFCENNLGIKLPAEVKSHEHLSLALLLLKNQNEPGCIESKFGDLIKNSSLVNPNPDDKTKLILELLDYKSKRLHEGDTYFSLFFQRDKYLSHAKDNVVKQVLRALRDDKKDIPFLSKSELDTLLDGRLGDIIKRYSNKDVLPEQIQKRLHENQQKEWDLSSIIRPKLR